MGIDLAHSVSVGDRWRDVAPALELGFRGWLVPSHNTPEGDVERARELGVLQMSLGEVVSLVIDAGEGRS
jgi:FMN phosphatase YigB (HAD superfamily)